MNLTVWKRVKLGVPCSGTLSHKGLRGHLNGDESLPYKQAEPRLPGGSYLSSPHLPTQNGSRCMKVGREDSPNKQDETLKNAMSETKNRQYTLTKYRKFRKEK
ncbi:hypothetical protein AVEN_114343-1 [Araneus ventricosus]|uniref:Uncharacterized protein n=1 Tax=Araneus ventricosus TaxID=182803 RepID=A0A4Y2GJW5_ARAVE|nr:hypothetical protein AVEN_114343-1 [Araneus ventricosus]